MIKNLYIINGFHRSGTSLIASLIKNFGIRCEENQYHLPNMFNNKGYFEDDRILNLHNKILKDHNRNWWDPSITKISIQKKEVYLNEIKKFLYSIKDEKNFFIKDPRIIIFYKLWQEAAKLYNIQINSIFIIRNPRNCAKSLEYRDGLYLNHAFSLWISYHSNISVIKELRSKSHFIVYEKLLSQPNLVVKNLANFISKNENIEITNKIILSMVKKIKKKKIMKDNKKEYFDRTKVEKKAIDIFKKIKNNNFYGLKSSQHKNDLIKLNYKFYLDKYIKLNRRFLFLGEEKKNLDKKIKSLDKKIKKYQKIDRILDILTNKPLIKKFIKLIK